MSETQLYYYYILAFLSIFYAFHKIGINKDSILIILIFWSGIFDYLDAVYGLAFSIGNIYKIFIVAYALYITGSKFFDPVIRDEEKINFSFLVFSISFWFTYVLRGGDIITISSQYLYKYGFVFILFHYLKHILIQKKYREFYKNALLTVLYIQVFLSAFKFIITIPRQLNGVNIEAVVGSVSAGGAGLAVVLPIISLIFYWFIRNGNFSRKDWAIAISFIIISVASGKRQPIILFPAILYLLFTYAKDRIKLTAILKYIPIIFLLFYLGARLNPTFNPENKVWGSFDFQHVVDYSTSYYFGSSDWDYILSDNYEFDQGRGSGIFYYFSPHKLNLNNLDEILFGKGLYEVAVSKRGRFTATGRSDYGVQHSGLIGQAGAIIYSLGYIGVISLLLLSYYLIRLCKNKKIASVILIYYLWDFLFYYNQVIFSNPSAILVLFIGFYDYFEDTDVN